MRSKRTASRIMAMAATLVATVGFAYASVGSATVTPDEALQRLLDGNKRYVESKMRACTDSDATARQKLTKGQHPYAIVLSCSDSRVPPELVFDEALGEIFVIRVAGNIPDPVVVGSIEYATEHLGSPLIMVLGHEHCGAVTAAVESNGKKAEGNIGAIVRAIQPAVAKARQTAKGKSKEELVQCAVEMNAKSVAANLTKHSKVLTEQLKEHKIKIVAAEYNLEDGKVTLLK